MKRAERMTKGEVAAWYFGTSDRWPGYFPLDVLSRYWGLAADWERDAREPGDGPVEAEQVHQEWVRSLRAALLKLLRPAASACVACDLAQFRLYAGAVLDDAAFENDPFAEPGLRGELIGPHDAEVMIVSEAPRDYEARTGVTLIGIHGLLGSLCARDCANFEACYPPEVPFPAQPCQPVSLRKRLAAEGEPDPVSRLPAIRDERARRRPWPTDMAGRLLDRALDLAGEWRESWNPRLRRYPNLPPERAAHPGTVYLTDLVKCRSAESPTKDRRPTKEEIAACHPHLEMQLYIVQPRALVALGNAALAALTGTPDPKILSLRGQVLTGPEGLPVVAEVHPRWIAERVEEGAREEHLKAMAESLKKARQLAQREDEPTPVTLAPAAEDPDDPLSGPYTATFPDPAMAQLLELDDEPPPAP